LENNFWDMFFWFVVGALSHSFLSRVFGVAKSVPIVKEAARWSFVGLKTTHDGIKSAQRYKHAKLKDSGLSKDELAAIENMDEIILDEWKSLSIRKLIFTCPPKYRAALGFNDWRSAEQIIRK